ncbi:indole-3-glycerol phosphate synthase TrpC [Blattabacterium cuenoti]|uniref:indole-3-glycerol phosphate synthase TrpC n=1 Tax=Blattabacterium cuenoti TaxID=1653831 RepID=UPI00163B75EB|nr:indole-3-glycerol phosphate synthase TrpC [Blattabacterium cuenoti]
MNILDKIIYIKKKEISKKKEYFPISKLEKRIFFKKKGRSLIKNLKKSKTGIIAEFKRKSPSVGIINTTVSYQKVVKDYEKAGACGISIITDNYFFDGKDQYLSNTHSIVSLPLLRKDFIINEYQIIESKSLGADVILLITEILSKKEIKNFSILAKNLDLEVIIEIHSEKEIDKLFDDSSNIIGINNRNLRNFIVNTNNCLKLSKKIPNHYIKIAESGISNPKKILYLRKKGFKGFLIGTNFMNTKNPGNSCKNMINILKNYNV